jgi:hypothetical protein
MNLCQFYAPCVSRLSFLGLERTEVLPVFQSLYKGGIVSRERSRTLSSYIHSKLANILLFEVKK